MPRPREQPTPVEKDGFWYLIRRVPPEFASVERRKRIVRSTNIRVAYDRLGVAARKEVTRMADELHDYWTAKLQGRNPEAPRRLSQAMTIAQSYGVPYLTTKELLDAGPEAVAERLLMLKSPNAVGNEPLFRSLLGGAEKPPKEEDGIKVSAILEVAEKIQAIYLSEKSPGQLRMWRQARQRTLNYFTTSLKVEKLMSAITRNDVTNYREQLQERVLEGQITVHTANKYIKQVGAMYNLIRHHYQLDLPNPFERVTFPHDVVRQREAFDPKWVQDKILADGQFDTMNPEARGIIYLMTETGLRTSEACNLLPENIRLDHDIPHIVITPITSKDNKRQLKTLPSKREIPLVGCALAAMRANPNGFPRYRDKEGSLSATLNKAFAAKKLFETDKQKVYSLRHTFKDRLIHLPETKDSLIDALMGHADDGQPYGKGYSLEFKLAVLEKIAFRPPPRV